MLLYVLEKMVFWVVTAEKSVNIKMKRDTKWIALLTCIVLWALGLSRLLV